MHTTHRIARFFFAIVMILTVAGCGDSGTVAPAAGRSDAAKAADRARLARLNRRTRRLERAVRRERAKARAAEAQGSRGEAEDEGDASATGGPGAGSFKQLEARLGGSSGLAFSSVGRGVPVTAYGSLTTGSAWSTMKVPVAVAAVTDQGGSPDATTSALLRSAITASDNAAADQLWRSLGPPEEAGRKTQSVLAEGSDPGTAVQTAVIRAGFSSFGQTQWALANQQRFIAALPCLSIAEPVLALMGQTVADQRWGLAATGLSANVKGGWGPDEGGRYLVRQMGIVQLSNGRTLAASLATMPSDGSYATGSANLTAIAQWLVENVDAGAVRSPAC